MAIGLVAFLMKLAARFLLAFLVLALLPAGMERVVERMVCNPFISGGTGAGTIIALPFVALILAITCVGILLLPAVALVFWVLYLVGMTAIYLLLGQRLRAAAGKNSYRPTWTSPSGFWR
jgi:hypothetical protein